MATDEGTQRPHGSTTIISRRRFLKQTAMATAVVSVPYLAGGSAAFGKEKVKGADAALDRALEELVAMDGGPPGAIAIVQRGLHREVHSFGVRNLKGALPIRANDHMRIASAAKAFSGAVALSLVSDGKLSLHDTIGERLPELPEDWSEVTLRQLLNHTSGIPDFSLDPDFRDALLASLTKAPRQRSCSPSWRTRICSSIPVRSTTTQTQTTSPSPLWSRRQPTVPTRASSRSTFSDHWN